MENTDTFLKEHKIRAADVDIQTVEEAFTTEMQKGLEGRMSSLRMIPTYIEAENAFLTEVPVAAIDAGGTNFRVATVKFSKEGKVYISNLKHAGMPGQNGEISRETFFQTIAGYVKDHVQDSDRIGFCFSYPTEILPNKDGKLLQFSKEVKAPEVVGELMGKNLLEALDMPHKQIVLLNDTVATLLAGKSASFEKNYDSFIGYILGTGTNTCYIETNRNIVKHPELDPSESQIINIESGNFGKAPRSDIDLAYDKTTINPGEYTFEKMLSGGYFGGLCLTTLKTAAKEGVFSEFASGKVLGLNKLTSEEVNQYVSNQSTGNCSLQSCFDHKSDEEICRKIIENLIDRAARLAAANLAAVVLKTNKGQSPDRPILITIEGTVFYKTHNLKALFRNYIKQYLSGERKRYYEFKKVEQSSLVGAALAALIN